MPAGIMSSDSMFSVRETPWHGLGAVLERPPVTIAALEVPSLPTAVCATAYRNGESVKFEPAPGVFVCSVVAFEPSALIVKTECEASVPARNTPVAVCRVPSPAVEGNSAGEEITPVATVGTPAAAAEGRLTGQPGRTAWVTPS